MQKTEFDELRRLKAVQVFLKRNTDLYAGYAGLERVSVQLTDILDKLDAVLILQRMGSKGVTLERKQHRKVLEQLLLTACSHLLVVADDLGLAGLRCSATVTPSYLTQLKSEEIHTLGNLVLTEVALREESLEATGYFVADRLLLKNAVALHNELIPATGMVIAQRKVGTASVPILLKQGLRLIKRQMLGFMARYRTTHPKFYEEFMEAKKLKRVGVRHEEEIGVAA